MFSRDSWQEIFETIRKNKLRTFLSGFTVALGIFIFVILFGMGNGLKNSFAEFFLDDSNNVLYLIPGKTTKAFRGFKKDRSIEFDNTDLADIKLNFPFYLEDITPRITRSAEVKYKNESDNYTTRGVAPAHQQTENTIIMFGRYLNRKDINEQSKVVVIGRLVSQDLFKNENPIGKYLDIDSVMFRVVGVFQDSGGDREERIIYLPFTTRQRIEKNNDKLDQILVTFPQHIGHAGSLAFEKKLRMYLKTKKVIDPTDSGGIFINNRRDNFTRNQQFANVLQIIVTFVGLGTLIAGIIGISNIMVFVVKERTKELGIRKALGATPRSVIQLILQESIFITLISGYMGMILGIILLKNVGVTLEDFFIKNPYIDNVTAFWATFILVVFGAVAGYIPAKRAARIKPIVALRDE